MKALLKNRTILVVEDEAWLLRDYATVLRESDANVITACCLDSAWSHFRRAKRHIDIALIDMYLPKKKGGIEKAGAGTELARMIRTSCSRSPKRDCPLLIGMSFHAPWAAAEPAAAGVDVVFVLLTPDDKVGPRRATDTLKRRGRQNVIFELGYFLGPMSRKSGRVILLKRGAVEIPSDITGLVYIDITKGIAAASEEIRSELVAASKFRKRSTSA